ncbi:scavenger receptor class B member 1-like isoform X1 [Rhynchophorus ferrugineus]|uniref:scavenger receptor class B member 1-like isoform X1 n=2 Tax=Rhynchophorus ferrugineus TaxID=354439 RepID=UPI003FCC638C
MELKYGLSKGVISMVAVGLFMVCTSTLMFTHNPIQTIIGMVLNLSDGTLFYNLWSAPPYDVFLKVYLFNITNKEEFLKGKEKINISEIGPYVYREILTNQNATFNDIDGTVTYQPHREIIFDKERSVGDPKKDFIFTTNLPLVGLQSYLADQSFIKNVMFAAAARTLGSKPVVNVTIDEYLWGYQDPLVQYANLLVPSWIDFNKFGIFERLMSRDNGNNVTVVKNPSKYHSTTDWLLTEEERMSQYHLVRWNNLAGLKDWGYEKLSPEEETKCLLVEGAFDGTIFPRNIRENRTLRLFRKAFCRPVPLTFIRKGYDDEGFDIYEYQLTGNIFDTTPENKCFCYKNNCQKGFQSIAPCYYGIPITLSQPHYLNADPKILNTVNGLNPDENLHGSFCQIQPTLGIPLRGQLRIQINLGVAEIVGNSQLKPFNKLQVPLFWVEIGTEDLPYIAVVLLNLLCKVLPIAIEILKYLLAIGGLAVISGSALYILFKARVSIPGSISLSATEYTAVPIISIPTELLDKCEKRLSLK